MTVSKSVLTLYYLLSDFIAGDLTGSAPFLVLTCLFSRVEMRASPCVCVLAQKRVCVCDKYPPSQCDIRKWFMIST